MIIKKTVFFAALALVSSLSAQAEIDIDSLIERAARDPKNASAITEHAAKQNPDQLLAIAAAAVARFPEQAVEIVGFLVKLAPKQVADIVRAAIEAQPSLAVEITTVAVAALPSSSEAIVQAALEVSPKEVRMTVASLHRRGPEQAFASPGRQSAPTFPSQPVRPDVIVSPSR